MAATLVAVTRAAIFAVKDVALLDVLGPDESIVNRRMRIRILCERRQIERTTRSQPDDQIVKRYLADLAANFGSHDVQAPLQLGRRKNVSHRETGKGQPQSHLRARPRDSFRKAFSQLERPFLGGSYKRYGGGKGNPGFVNVRIWHLCRGSMKGPVFVEDRSQSGSSAMPFRVGLNSAHCSRR